MSNILHSQSIAVLQHFSDNVRRIRSGSGMSQDHLARRSGVSRRMISAIEAGNANVSLATIDRLASAFEIPFSELVRAPEASDNREIRGLAWKGSQPGSEAVLLGAAPGGGEIEMWVWTLAPCEIYTSETGSEAWHEMIFVTRGTLVIERGGTRCELNEGDFQIFNSPEAYAFVNASKEPVRFVRNIAMNRAKTFIDAA